jgi:SAM-dependent methyltransferase
MWVDVSELHRFYESALGAVVQQTLKSRIHELWPNVREENVAAYGYGIPYLDVFWGQAARIFDLMPAHQGALHWPEGRPNLTVLCEETHLPLADQSLDKLLIIHALEHTYHACELLREAWRVLVDGGKLMIIVPNRQGLWARTVSTPFGHGQPYTGNQLFSLVEQNFFSPNKPHYSLYMPPAAPNLLSGFYESLEGFGRRWSKKLGGVVILEARKTVLGAVVQSPQRWKGHIFIPQACDAE